MVEEKIFVKRQTFSSMYNKELNKQG